MKGTRIIISSDQLTTIPEAAKEIGVHFATLYRWLKKGKLHPIHIGNQDFLTIDEVKTLKERNKGAAEQKAQQLE